MLLGRLTRTTDTAPGQAGGSDMEERLCQLMDLLIEMGTSAAASARVLQAHAPEVLATSRLIERSPQLLKVCASVRLP